jgi:teichuronic acid biosynthesis glycosyltransferase TuaC
MGMRILKECFKLGLANSDLSQAKLDSNLKVLFVRSGNKGQHPITQNQGDSLVAEGCEVHYYNVVGRGLIGYLKNLPELNGCVKKVKPDIIHAHYSLCGFLVSLGFFRKPIIVSLMGSDVLASTFLYHGLIRIFNYFSWNLVVFKSKEMQSKLRLSNSCLIPNGVDSKVFYRIDKQDARRQLGWSQDKKIVLFASDPLRSEKNYPLFCKVFELIKINCPDVEEKWLINLDKHQMMLYYNAADVLLLTSFHEGSPNVIKEAIFCGCPFVSVPVGDVQQWVEATTGNAVAERSEYLLLKKVEEVMGGRSTLINTDIQDLIDSSVIARKLKSKYFELIQSS